MRKISWLTLVATLFMLSCSNGNPKPNGIPSSEEDGFDKEPKIDFSKTDFSDFVVTKEFGEDPSCIQYAFSGAIKNTTENIYETVFLRCNLFFVFKNEKVLSSENMTDLFTSSFNFYNWDYWKPQQVEKIPKITSSPLKREYADYPIVKVIERMSLDLKDEINNTKTSTIVEQVDVTDKWVAAVAKVKKGKYDCLRSRLENLIRHTQK